MAQLTAPLSYKAPSTLHRWSARRTVHLYTWSVGRGVRYIRCAITTVTACRRWPVIEHRALPQAVPHGRQWSRQPCDVASKRTVHRSNSTWAPTEPKPERTHIYMSFLMRRAPYVTDLQPPRRARTAECIQRHWSWPLDDSSYRPTQICISSSCFTSSCKCHLAAPQSLSVPQIISSKNIAKYENIYTLLAKSRWLFHGDASKTPIVYFATKNIDSTLLTFTPAKSLTKLLQLEIK